MTIRFTSKRKKRLRIVQPPPPPVLPSHWEPGDVHLVSIEKICLTVCCRKDSEGVGFRIKIFNDGKLHSQGNCFVKLKE